MRNEAERVLRHSVRLRVVLRYVGELSLVLGLTALAPMICAVLLQEFHLILPYGLVAVVLLALGVLARQRKAPREVQQNEALVITVLVFLLSPLVMSGALVFQGIAPIDALFEALSGVTTTGLSTLATIETRSSTFLFARAWMQWVGGLGFVVLSLALTLDPGTVSSRRLGTPSLSPTDFVGSMRAHARLVALIYVTLTGLGITALVILGASPFDAVVHSLAGISTGGFAPRDASLAELHPRLQYGILSLSILGAVSLPLFAELRDRRWKRFLGDAEAHALLLLIAIVGVFLYVTNGGGDPIGDPSVSDLALLSISAQTTAGFSTFSLEELSTSATAILIVSMISGGSQGSTAGGLKLRRLLLMARYVQWLIAKTHLPAHAVSAPALSGEPLESSELLRAASLILLFLGVVVVSWLPFLAYGYAPLDSLFEVASATGTVGLSMGISRPDLEPVLKGVLGLDMLLGRLEVFAVLIALSPRTWFGRRAS